MGAKPMFTPSSVALNSSSFMTCPEWFSSMRMRMPSESVEWMSACPMSSTFASYLANIPITEAVSPGRSCPVILTRICSSFCIVCCSIVQFVGVQSYGKTSAEQNKLVSFLCRVLSKYPKATEKRARSNTTLLYYMNKRCADEVLLAKNDAICQGHATVYSTKDTGLHGSVLTR